ncbi:MAG: histidine phosphatase family protein [Candidatus Zixiibacteriota bacterium]
MKRIYLIRHSYAVGDRMLSDRERPLTDDGKRAALSMSRELLNGSHIPDCIISSPAQRALETAIIFAGTFNISAKNITTHESLYDNLRLNSFLHIIDEVNEKYQSVFVFGHNPIITEISTILSPEFNDAIPPCGVAGIEFKVEKWSDINVNEGRLLLFEKP